MPRTKSAYLGKKSSYPLNYYIFSKSQEIKNNKNKRLFKTINTNNHIQIIIQHFQKINTKQQCLGAKNNR